MSALTNDFGRAGLTIDEWTSLMTEMDTGIKALCQGYKPGLQGILDDMLDIHQELSLWPFINSAYRIGLEHGE